MDPHKTTRFGLIRHAQTQWNKEKRIQGQLDSPLTNKGIEQARQWGRILTAISWDGCIFSDLGRAEATAGLINEQVKVPMAGDPRLREQDWGRWTGKTLAGLQQECPEALADQVARGWSFCPPEGEDRLAVYERGQAALIDAAGRCEGGTVLVVAHEGLIKSLLYRCLGRQFLPTETAVLKSCHLHWTVCRNGQLSVDRLNALNLDH